MFRAGLNFTFGRPVPCRPSPSRGVGQAMEAGGSRARLSRRAEADYRRLRYHLRAPVSNGAHLRPNRNGCWRYAHSPSSTPMCASFNKGLCHNNAMDMCICMHVHIDGHIFLLDGRPHKNACAQSLAAFRNCLGETSAASLTKTPYMRWCCARVVFRQVRDGLSHFVWYGTVHMSSIADILHT